MLNTSGRKALLATALLLALASPMTTGKAQAGATDAQAVREDALAVTAAPTAIAGLAHREGHHGRKHHRRLDDMAEVLGMTSDQLIGELKKGKSIAQIGQSRGISEDQLIGKLLDKERVHLKEQINRSWGAEAKKNT
ncbi:hypothetical protein [Cohnella sp. 56]|uniref:hypothetical protein n=1 Tax=Cohnella sp. 56 TaxID=3113722 RepID=UPI0030EAE1F7